MHMIFFSKLFGVIQVQHLCPNILRRLSQFQGEMTHLTTIAKRNEVQGFYVV